MTTRLAVRQIRSNMIDGRNILKQNFRLMAKSRDYSGVIHQHAQYATYADKLKLSNIMHLKNPDKFPKEFVIS